MKRKIMLLASLFTLSLVMAHPTFAAETAVKFKVFDAKDRSPIAKAIVTLHYHSRSLRPMPWRAETDTDGNAVFNTGDAIPGHEGVTMGKYHVTHPDFNDAAGRITLPRRGETLRVPVPMQRRSPK